MDTTHSLQHWDKCDAPAVAARLTDRNTDRHTDTDDHNTISAGYVAKILKNTIKNYRNWILIPIASKNLITCCLDYAFLCQKILSIYSLGHGLHILTAVPRSTQPSTLRGMVNEYQVLGWVLIILAMVEVVSGSLQAACGQPTRRLTARVVWPELRVGGHLAPFHIHNMNSGNTFSGSSYCDSTIQLLLSLLILLSPPSERSEWRR